MAEGQNLNFAIPVEKVPTGHAQLPSEQIPGSGPPAATPTIDAKVYFNGGKAFYEATKEVVGIHVLLTRSLCGDGILRRLLPPVSLAKPTSARLRF
jgi:hypothetical protein